MATVNPTWLKRIAETGRYYGPSGAAHWMGSRILEKLLRVQFSELLYLDADKLPSSFELPPDFTFRFLTPSEVAHFVQDPSLNLAGEFVDRSASRHDLCFAVLHEERLVSYSWYATRCIEGAHHLGIAMSYPRDMAYMYNAFTHPSFRGRRLYGIGIALALQELQRQGIPKLITTVEGSNFASLRSCYRIGFTNLGRMWTFGHGNRRFALTPKLARKMGICFGRQANVS
ncbi:MAG TPA: hypothetical protein VFE46_08440 [Pirellulales bacterium]|nr:hypothetical protein [Pirellulales bacterium]